MSRVTSSPAAIGKGLVAGFAGTAAMTVSSTLEARIRGRAPSSAPARATAKVLGIKEFEDGVAAGALQRPLALGLRHRLGRRARPARRDRHVAAGGDDRARRRDLRAPRRSRCRRSRSRRRSIFWGKQEIAIDAFHHAVYAAATGLAYQLVAGRVSD